MDDDDAAAAEDDDHHHLGIAECSVSIQTPTYLSVTYMIFEVSMVMKI
jgi:hypothetical protein